MFELTIDNKVYGFHFGMGFVKEINRTVEIPMEGAPKVTQNAGLRYKIGAVMDGDVEALVEMLDIANKTETPRISRAELEEYIEDEGTDIDQLFEDVLDFLSASNCTKKTMVAIRKAIAEATNKD